MISGGAAEREDREDEAESDKPEGTQPAQDKTERALSSALSPEHASDKGEEAPVSSKETGSSSNDKVVPSQAEQINGLRMTRMYSQTEITVVISPKADKCGSTQLSLDKSAQDKNEDEDGVEIPPPLFKNCSDNLLESEMKQNAARERTKQQRTAHEISSSSEGGRHKPKQISQTGPWRDKSNQGKSAAPKISGGVERTTLFPHCTTPFRYAPKDDSEGTQFLALGELRSHQGQDEDKSDDQNKNVAEDQDEDCLVGLDELDEDLYLGSPEGGDSVDYTSEGADERVVIGDEIDNLEDKALGGIDTTHGKDEDNAGDNKTEQGHGDKDEAPSEISARNKQPIVTQQVIMELVEKQASWMG